MTDPGLADRTYVEPLTKEFVEAIIKRERPDALLPTVGGQTALNLAVELAEAGVLDKYGVEMIGAKAEAVKMAEDRLLFKQAMKEIGLETPRSEVVGDMQTARAARSSPSAFPAVIRPSFTLGGTGGGIAFNNEEYEEIVQRGLDLSPVHEVLVEESVLGWKEYELEVMRDLKDNVVIICSIENFDPMGVHTGDSITVAPAQTLTDREYQRMRDASVRRDPADRRRDRRFQHPVRREPGGRPAGGHRNESARFAKLRAGVEGDRISDRENRRQACCRLHAERDSQRHHEEDSGIL